MPNWSEVYTDAQRLFDKWPNNADLLWAEEMWEYFKQDGYIQLPEDRFLADTQAKFWLVVLAEVYLTFSAIAFNKEVKVTVLDLANKIHLDPCAVGILATRETVDEVFDLYDDRDQLHYEVYEALAAKIRPYIYYSFNRYYIYTNWTYARLITLGYENVPKQPEFIDPSLFETPPNKDDALNYLDVFHL